MPELPIGIAAAQLAAALLVLALLSIPLARSVTAPVEQLAALTRAFGAGDLSARVRSKRGDEIGDLGRAFDEMADRIADLRRSEKELLANVSHELRTPLARISVALDIASEGDAGAARRSLEEIAVDLGELEGMIDDILTTTRMDLQSRSHKATGFSLRRSNVAPGSVAEQASERFRARYPERELLLSIAAGLPEVFVDAGLLRRVLDNLLDNAQKYSPPERAIRLSLSFGSELVFEVTDDGIGIAPNDMPRVFEPFFRAERSRSRGTGGVGLGLTLAKRIVDAHDGRIELASAAGQGTRARVYLAPTPLAAASAPPAAERREPSGARSPAR
jgi:signal transduction histidine kinase